MSKIINTDDWYRFVAVARLSAWELRLRDGQQHNVVPVNDDIIEVFQKLKPLGEDSAIIFDSAFQKCWFTTRTEAEPFLDYSMTIDDEYCDIESE